MIENKKLQWPGMSLEKKKQQAVLIAEKRKIVSQEPTCATEQEAVKTAVIRAKREKGSFPSVWKEPQDIGSKFAVIHTKNRENAHIAGYDEKVGEQEIHDLANGTDEIKEV